MAGLLFKYGKQARRMGGGARDGRLIEEVTGGGWWLRLRDCLSASARTPRVSRGGCAFRGCDDGAFASPRQDRRAGCGNDIAGIRGGAGAFEHQAAQRLGGGALAQRLRRIDRDAEAARLRRDLGDLRRRLAQLRRELGQIAEPRGGRGWAQGLRQPGRAASGGRLGSAAGGSSGASGSVSSIMSVTPIIGVLRAVVGVVLGGHDCLLSGLGKGCARGAR
jgi:hypothetical protein